MLPSSNHVYSACTLILLVFLATNSRAQNLPKMVDLFLDPTPYDSMAGYWNQMRDSLQHRQAKIHSWTQRKQTSADSLTHSWASLSHQKKRRLDSLMYQKKAWVQTRADSLPGATLPWDIMARVPLSIPEVDLSPPDLPALNRPSLPQIPTLDLMSRVESNPQFRGISNILKRQKGLTDTLSQLRSHRPVPEEVSQIQRYKDRISQDSLAGQSLRDTLLITAQQEGEAWASQQVSEQLEGHLPEPMMTATPEEEALRQRLTQEAQAFFGADPALLQQAQSGLAQWKKTYRQVQEQDSVYISNTSLQEVPIRQRFMYGINLDIDHVNTTSLQLRPQLGYQFNRVWTGGVAGLIQTTWGTTPFIITPTFQGGAGFIRRDVAGKLIGYAEVGYEKPVAGQESQDQSAWNYRAFLGIGKQIAVSQRLALQLLFLWNGLSDRQMSTQERFQVRVGVIRLTTH